MEEGIGSIPIRSTKFFQQVNAPREREFCSQTKIPEAVSLQTGKSEDATVLTS
jgi:hypothetical protein